MNHPFYNKSTKKQNTILFTLAVGAIFVIALSIVVSMYTGIYFLGIIMFAITLSVVAPFFDMPSLKKSGKITYYAPLFIAETPKDNKIKVHGGTLFDYYFVIDRNLNGKQRTEFILQQYVSGLLALMEHHQQDTQLKVHGTSYIINQRTAEKLGFDIVETDMLQKLILIYNYVNVLLSNSIAKNRWSFPKINQTKTFEASISQLLERKDYLQKLHDKLAA